MILIKYRGAEFVDIEPFGKRMIELLPQLVRGFARREHNYLSRGKITLPQLWTLELLTSYPSGCPMNELARLLDISRPAATGLIDRLLTQNLVQRTDDVQDRRIVRVTITSKGRRILAAIWEQKRQMVTQVFGQISPKDRSQYLSTLEQVVAILTQPQQKRLPRKQPAVTIRR